MSIHCTDQIEIDILIVNKLVDVQPYLGFS